MYKQRPRTPREAARRRDGLDRLLSPEVFRALGDPTRVALLACLARCARECSVSEIAECCSVDFSVVSRHLSMLANVGVVASEKRGRTVFYRVRLRELCSTLRALADALEQCCGPDPVRGCGATGACGCNPETETTQGAPNDASRE